MRLDDLKEKVHGKKVLFVSTKNKDYLRNVQEIEFLEKNSGSCDVIAYRDKSYLKRLVKVYAKMIPKLFSKKYDYFFIGFAPQFVFILFPFIKTDKLIIDFFISFYDTLVDDRKKLKASSFLARIVKKVDRYVLKKACIAVVDTQADRDYFVQEFNIAKEKFLVWYIEADLSIFDPKLYPIKENGKFEVVYFGSILPLQGIEVILEATKQLQNEPEIHFTIVGPIAKDEAADKAHYPNVTFIPWLSQEKLAEVIQQADLCLAGHFNGTIGKADRTIAGKTYIYKAMQKPIILGESRANREKFIENSENYYVPRGDATALSQKIKEVYRIESK